MNNILKTNDIEKKICKILKNRCNTVFPRSVAAATINFSFTEVRRLFEGGVYSARRAGLPPSRAASTHVKFVLGLLALTPACVMADKLAQFSFLLLLQSRAIAVTAHVGNVIVTVSSHLRMRIATVHMNIIKCGYCSRAATITFSPRSLRRLFEVGVYSGCGVYSRKYGTCNMVFHSFAMFFRFFLLNSSISLTQIPTNMKICMHTYFIRSMCTIWLYFR